MNNLIELSRTLYHLKRENQALKIKNEELEESIALNEENVLATMEACVELYEMLIIVDEPMALGYAYNYGDDEEAEVEMEVKPIMVTVYCTLILKGKKKVSQVPVVIRGRVIAQLKELLDVETIPEELM